LIALAEGCNTGSADRIESFVKQAVAVLVDGGINARGAVARPKSSGKFRAALSRGIKPPSPEAKILITWPQLAGKFYVAPSGSASSSNSILAFFSAVIDPNSRRTFVLASFALMVLTGAGSAGAPAAAADRGVSPSIVAAAARAATPDIMAQARRASKMQSTSPSRPTTQSPEAAPSRGKSPLRNAAAAAVPPPTSSMQLIGTTFVRRNKAELGFTLLEFNHEIDELVPGGIAARAGILPGDQVFTVNGLELTNKDHDEVVAAFQSTLRMKSFAVQVLRELPALESIGEMPSQVQELASVNEAPAPAHEAATRPASSARAASPVVKDNGELEVNDQVETSKGKVGEIAFIGATRFASGAWAGVVFPKTVGKNDGSVNGVRYFRCRPRHGAFFRPDVLTLVAKRPPTARDITKASSLYKQGPRNVVSPEIV